MGNKKKSKVRVVLAVMVILMALLMVGWKIGYEKIHKYDCCSAESKEYEECRKNAKTGKERLKCSMSYIDLPVCSKCEKPIYDNSIYVLAGLEIVFVLSLIKVLLSKK